MLSAGKATHEDTDGISFILLFKLSLDEFVAMHADAPSCSGLPGCRHDCKPPRLETGPQIGDPPGVLGGLAELLRGVL